MKRGMLGIFDYEFDYASSLMEYFNQKAEFPYETCVFTTIESLQRYLCEKKLASLLICEEAIYEELDLGKVPNIMLLSENSCVAENISYPVIYKFQSGDQIMKEVCICLEGISPVSSMQVMNPGLVEFIGVVSPKGGSGKTIFSLALGEIYARKEKVLYISFEEIGSRFLVSGEQKGLSDLIYYIKQKKQGIRMLLHSIGVSIGGVDCILSVSHYTDLQVLEKEDVDYLMDEITKSEQYKKIIFDIGRLNDLTLHILEKCNSVYVTHLHKDSYLDKREAFENLFRFEEKERVLERAIFLDLPEDKKISQGNYNIENLVDGELGDFIAKHIEAQ